MTIDSCYEGIIAKLTKKGEIVPVSKKLQSLTTNHERVLYVYDIIKDLNAFPEYLGVQKSVDLSTYYRNLGNKHFLSSNNYGAWQYYNLSLLHAPLDSDNYSLALGNRSAVLLKLNKHKECLRDIEMVFSSKYPENLKVKLEKRKSMCKTVKDRKDVSAEEFITLKGERDPVYVSASSKLQVEWSKKMGRHVVAKEDIKVGEVLVHEEPYFTLLLKSQYLFSCSHCLSRTANLWPCDNCCFSLYCSQECKEKAHKSYHAIECPLMATFVEQDFTKLELLGLRTVIKARNDHDDWESLQQTVELADKQKNTENYGRVKIKDKWIYDSKYYTSIHCLESNIDKRTISDVFQKSVTAAVLLNLLKEKTAFLKGADEEQILNCASGLLLHHEMTSPTNMHGISSTVQNVDGVYVDELSLACAPYAFLSLLNHSCAPNVVRSSTPGSGRMKLFALRPIKKGMQIFDNYGAHHALENRTSRQRELMKQYRFTCQCDACRDNWPLYFQLTTGEDLPNRIRKLKSSLLATDAIESLQKGDRATAMKLFRPLCELAELLEPYAPCIELADCQESLKQCLVIMEGLIPYGYSKAVEWTARPPKNLRI